MINQSRLIFITLLVCSMSFCQQLSRESSVQKFDSMIKDESIDPNINPSDRFLEPVQRSEDDPDADLDPKTISKPDASMATQLEPNSLMIIPRRNANSNSLRSGIRSINIGPCIRGDWPACRAELSNLLRGFIASFFSFQNRGTVTILNRVCTIGVRRRLRLGIPPRILYDAQLTCPFGIRSDVRGFRSARDAAEAAVRQFFQINAALIQSMINNNPVITTTRSGRK